MSNAPSDQIQFATILVGGPDAHSFLQGQLSCDLNDLAEKTLLGSLNSAQGRVQAVLNVVEHEKGVALRVIASMAERTGQRLRKYVLRSKVTIDLGDPQAAPTPATRALDEIRAGLPHVLPETDETFVAQMLNLDLLGAINFNKGCYTGQEIIARTHYRGAIKRRMFRFAAKCPPPAPGARLTTEAGAPAGEVVYAAANDVGCELLAVVSLAQAHDSLMLQVSSTALLSPLTLPYSIEE